MKIVILGGGPAGLYAGILLKGVNTTWDITVLERNPEGATYGFGVVLSDRTLTSFREADRRTYDDITNGQVLWHAIDVHYRGTILRTGGHTFAGIARRTLLDILQRRCREMQVELRFGVDIKQLSDLPDADLIVGADGLNSLVKRTYAGAFKPQARMGRLKYIWLGTHRLFDAFTFLFRENDHGVFQVHAYPFDGTTSTAVVMCDESTWESAGLDRAEVRETIAYLENLFAPDLAGNGLLSNQSRWVNFTTIKHRSWHHANTVLLGDAAHTVHFSIGSGTKLAMEDAVALASAFERNPDRATALTQYELERRPILDRFGEVARESEAYFQNIERYMHLEPLQFAFQLLTRSGTIDYENLRIRDPSFVDVVDRWYVRPQGPPPIVAPAPALTPLRLRDISLANRVVLAPLGPSRAEEGAPDEAYTSELVDGAERSPGLLLTDIVAVERQGRITPESLGMFETRHAEAWKRVVAEIHGRSEVRTAVQLGHAGRRGSTRPRREGLDRPLRYGNWPLIAASPLRYASNCQTPREMDRADMVRVRDAFVRAACLADEAGFDMIQINMAHGYLLAGFLSPLTNVRSDAYGSGHEGRMAFPLEVVAAVRETWPANRPLSVAVTATDWARGGTTVDDAVFLCRALREKGVDLIEVQAGQTVLESKGTYGPGYLIPYSDRLRHEAGIRTMAGGHITTTSQLNTILAAGRADLCILAMPATGLAR